MDIQTGISRESKMSTRYATDIRQAVYHLRSVFELNPYLAGYNWAIMGRDNAIFIQTTVHHAAIASLAESVANRIYGDVYHITSRIDVDPEHARFTPRASLFKKIEDLNIWTSITIKFDLNRYTHQGSIYLDVSSGLVTLSGTVNNRIARYYAEELAYDTFGIVGIQNQITVDPDIKQLYELPASPFLKTPLANLKIMLALSKRFYALPVRAKQERDTIVLEGEVYDELARKRLVNLASSVLGINRVVINALTARHTASA